MKMQKITISAPGKVLITGGYLILDKSYSGLVLGTSSRFYCTLEEFPIEEEGIFITVESPQLHFKNRYKFYKSGDEYKLDTKGNLFVEYSIFYALCLVSHKSGDLKNLNLNLKVLADNDFYSQIDSVSTYSMEALKKLPKFNIPEKGAPFHKTGLGSSSALVTSIVASLLHHFKIINVTNRNQLEIVHRVAQLAHCMAQGKVGSGFDVSSATFGSQKYNRFDANLFKDFMKFNFNLNDLNLLNNLIYEKLWDHSIQKFRLPKHFDLLLGDVRGGSQTPSMVKKVLEWRSKDPESKKLWDDLHLLNCRIEKIFNDLIYLENNPSYLDDLNLLNTYSIEQLSSSNSLIVNRILELRETFNEIRYYLKLMGQKSKVDIEPDAQTELIYETMNINGCVFAGVPGAGGFDAIFCIVVGEEARRRVEEFWINYKKVKVCPLLLGESSDGIKLE